MNCFRDLKNSDILESDKESKVSDEDEEKSITIVDVVSHINDGKESNLLSPQSEVSDCTKINLGVEAVIERLDRQVFGIFCVGTL